MTSTSPAEPSAKPPRLRRWLVRAGFILACLATLIVAFFLEEKIRGRAAWRAYETEARQRGVKLAFADFIPPQIPDAENFASIPIFDEAFRATAVHQPVPDPFFLNEPGGSERPYLNNPEMGERTDLVAWQKYLASKGLLSDMSADAAADVLRALDRFAVPLAQLHEAGTRPGCRFPVHWEEGFAALLPHLGLLKEAARFYFLRASAHLARGESAAAYEDFHDGLRLTTATRGEPSLIAGLVRGSMAGMMENAVWGGLAGHQWAEPELRKIDADLATLDWLQEYFFAMGSERAATNLLSDMLIENPGLLAQLAPELARDSGFHGQGAWAFRLHPTGWFYDCKVRSNRLIDEMLARFDPVQRRWLPTRALPSLPENIKGLPEKVHYMLFALMTPIYAQVEQGFIKAVTETDRTRLACALERFRLARGTLPATLAELTPDFLAALPVEILNGESYHYRREPDGSFVLYSVGPDLRDDGGITDPRHPVTQRRDWIWRYPAK